jgi:predicted SAM-dependent methyltransferase
MERVKKIRETSWDLFHENIRTLVAKDCKDKGLLKVDIGGGLNPFRDYITIDLRPEADIQGDLNEKFPLEDNSVGLLNAHHILEHLKNPMFSMQEIYRVLAHGGWAFIEVPSTDGRGA